MSGVKVSNSEGKADSYKSMGMDPKTHLPRVHGASEGGASAPNSNYGKRMAKATHVGGKKLAPMQTGGKSGGNPKDR